MTVTPSHSSTVAVLGAGIMARGMVSNIRRSGLRVHWYNRTKDTLLPYCDDHVLAFDSPAEAATGADFILSCVADDEASEQVWFGPKGALESASAGTVGIETSTLSVKQIKQWSHSLQNSSVYAVDSPVTGSRPGAENGSLILFAGGTAEAIAKALPVLSAISQRVHRVGESGDGAQFKLMYNLFSGTILVALAEALLLAREMGFDLHQVREILELDGGWSAAVTRGKGNSIVEDTHHDIFCKLSYLQKDLSYALLTASDQNVQLPVGEMAHQMLKVASEAGLGEMDMSAIGRLYLDRRNPLP